PNIYQVLPLHSHPKKNPVCSQIGMTGYETPLTNSRTDDSAQRPSADFVARFKEQHFSPEHQSDEHLKQESDMGHLTHSMYLLFGVKSDGARYDLDPTPKASRGLFRFTPSLL